jgi:hypothetical protein
MPFSEIPKIGPPKPSEIEICVFGPNYGECIVVHLGNGHWVVIDSCLFEDTGIPTALAYFAALQIRPDTAVKAVIATHWHDDHYKGLSKIMQAAPDAHVCISLALTRPEFLKFTTRMRKNKTAIAGTKLNEFSAAIGEIRDRKARGLVNFNFAHVRTQLHEVPSTQSGHGLSCEVVALSPSNGDILDFLERISLTMPQKRTTKRAISSAEPNEVSVVTLIRIGDIEILLGADLENSGRPNSGLEAIISSHRAAPFGSGASLYKVGHHGSDTAYNADIWAELLVKDVSAVVTPWRKGAKRLPTIVGAKMILNHTSEAFITASDARTRRTPKARPPSVLRHLRENNQRLRSLKPPFGAVRFRMADHKAAKWNIELFGSACHLGQFMGRRPQR